MPLRKAVSVPLSAEPRKIGLLHSERFKLFEMRRGRLVGVLLVERSEPVNCLYTECPAEHHRYDRNRHKIDCPDVFWPIDVSLTRRELGRVSFDPWRGMSARDPDA